MALTLEQQQALIRAKAQGLSKEQAIAQVFRSSQSKPQPSRFADAGEDISTAFKSVGSDMVQRGDTVRQATDARKAGQQGLIETSGQIAGQIAMGAGDLAFRGTQAVVKPFMSQEEEEKLAQGFGEAVQKTGLVEKYDKQSDRTKRNLGIVGGLVEMLTAGVAKNPLKGIGKGKNVSPSFEVQKIDDVIDNARLSLKKQSEDVNLTPRQQEEAANAALTIQERYIGMTPDIKKRLGEMGPEKLQEYLDAVHFRNIDDTVPTPYEYAASVVDSAEEALKRTLDDTGAGIGQARQKLSTVQLTNPQVKAIEDIFQKELSRLNLEVREGSIFKTPGKISPVEGGDIRALQALYNDLKLFKQSPTVANAIDLRKNFDGKIKFGKSAREVSNNVDGTSRQVRKAIANEAAKTVGKQNAAELTKYADFMDAYGDLQSFTQRKAGGEYLLRLVLSGRGGEARRLINTIKEYTGIDLMNDAVAMKLATELLGNEQTKNLFRQEITRAGYDAGALLSGSPTGILSVIGKRLLDKGIDVEDILKKAAAAGGGIYAYNLLIDSDENEALMLGLVIGSVVPTVRKDVVKALAKKVDDATVGEMQDFSRVVREGGAVTNNKGQMTFKAIEGMSEKEVRRAWEGGLRLVEIDTKTFDVMGERSPGDIAKLFDDVIKETENTLVKPKNPVEKKTNTLLEEAKGKSLDEFMKAQKPLYHGTKAKFDSFSNEKSLDGWMGKGVYITPDKTVAKKYGQVMEVYPSSLNIYEAQSSDWMSVLSELNKKYPEIDVSMRSNLVDVLKEKGYDGIQMKSWDEDIGTIINVFDADKIKTRSQLEDIWKQANE